LPPPSSHTTWHTGPYQGGSCLATLFLPCCLSPSKRPALSRGFRPLPPALGPLTRHLLKKIRNLAHIWLTGSALCRMVSSTPTASADFYQPIPSLCNDGSTWQVGRPPGKACNLHPIYPPHLLLHLPVIIGLWILWPPRPDVAASMRFLFVEPGLCLQLPSDSTSQWTPLLSG